MGAVLLPHLSVASPFGLGPRDPGKGGGPYGRVRIALTENVEVQSSLMGHLGSSGEWWASFKVSDPARGGGDGWLGLAGTLLPRGWLPPGGGEHVGDFFLPFFFFLGPPGTLDPAWVDVSRTPPSEASVGSTLRPRNEANPGGAPPVPSPQHRLPGWTPRT